MTSSLYSSGQRVINYRPTDIEERSTGVLFKLRRYYVERGRMERAARCERELLKRMRDGS